MPAAVPPPPEPSSWRARGGQAAVLLIASCASVLGTLLIAPVLPQLEEAYASTPGISALAPMVMTFPALGIALLGPVAGGIADRFGRTRLLFWSMLAYALVGTAPLWLDSLAAILVSRALLGAVEAAIMTCTLTLLGDYFEGERRDRYMSWHSMISAFSAVVFLAVGGALGSSGWRTPFVVYLVALPLLLAMLFLLKEPKFDRETAGLTGRQVRPMPWKTLAPMLALTLLGAIFVFFALQVQLSFVLDEVGVSSARIGASAAIANLGVMISALYFAGSAGRNAGGLLVASFVIGPVGLFLMSIGSTWTAVTAGAFTAGLGAGLMLPTLLVGTTSRLAFDQRGRGTAGWTSVFFLGQFFSPVVIAALEGTVGLQRALQVCAVLGLATAVAALLLVRSRPLQTSGGGAGAGHVLAPADEPAA